MAPFVLWQQTFRLSCDSGDLLLGQGCRAQGPPKALTALAAALLVAANGSNVLPSRGSSARPCLLG